VGRCVARIFREVGEKRETCQLQVKSGPRQQGPLRQDQSAFACSRLHSLQAMSSGAPTYESPATMTYAPFIGVAKVVGGVLCSVRERPLFSNFFLWARSARHSSGLWAPLPSFLPPLALLLSSLSPFVPQSFLHPILPSICRAAQKALIEKENHFRYLFAEDSSNTELRDAHLLLENVFEHENEYVFQPEDEEEVRLNACLGKDLRMTQVLAFYELL